MDPSTKNLSERERREEIVRAARKEGERQTGQIGSSASLVRLANRLGVSIETLAIRLSSDTVRRCKYPVIEETHEDGTVSYKHPIQVLEGPLSR
jgi:hypothetical protein